MARCGIDALKSALPNAADLPAKWPSSSQNSKNSSEIFLELLKIRNPARHLHLRIFAAPKRRNSPQTLAFRRSLIFRLVLIKSLEFGFAHGTRNQLYLTVPWVRIPRPPPSCGYKKDIRSKNPGIPGFFDARKPGFRKCKNVDGKTAFWLSGRNRTLTTTE